MVATTTLDTRPVLVPAGGMMVRPEPEDPSPSEEVATSLAMNSLLGMLGVPEGVIRALEVAHDSREAAVGGQNGAAPRPLTSSPNISPTAFRPQDAFRPRTF